MKLEEACEACDAQIAVELPSNTPNDVESNTERTAAWIASPQSASSPTKGAVAM